MKSFFYVLFLAFFAFSLQAMEEDRVPSLKSLSSKVISEKGIRAANLPEDISTYIDAAKKAITLSGNAQEALYYMVKQDLLVMNEQITFLRQRDPHLDLNHKYYSKDKFGKTVLMLAAETGNLKAMRILLQNGARINEKTIHGWTALEYATRFGRPNAVQLSLENGADVNLQDGFNRTALIQAVRHEQPQIVKLLLQANANRSLTDNDGNNAYGYALLTENPELINLLKP